ncbi:hypothetical protein UA38_11515 [Photobacterium kishitanii]|uniref:Uncharacterized protein n=1 Tax=Photobacterium kishitanii TaxID=318456 RepID=A0AAX0YSM1_9GAMM|nr:hypothetical protein [Photobacterium kishitanii]KJG57193.1 hypothetical protein UA38_11515 [Photobacterium kishitanii]KJG60514.1 hypothetical protein UA42_15320 [Photobacterium kishitanii]KJG64812.1 hypothetical protein UA40_15035 [Photobacterium kishitanii]KJG69009.1 hypothetical protein UA41_14165 [Photobacterium kishitanii]PSX17386.1 hypothetical protein C0W70_20710 [Photobacterium kishitanii]
MIYFDTTHQNYIEEVRVGSDGPIILIDETISSIDQLNTSLITNLQIQRLNTLIEQSVEKNKKCWSANELSQLFNIKINTARPISHQLKKAGICRKEKRFLHKNSRNGSLYIISATQDHYGMAKNSTMSEYDLAIIDCNNRHLIETGDANPLKTPTRSINEHGLLSQVINTCYLPKHTSFADVLPASKQNVNNQQYERQHSDNFRSQVTATKNTYDIARPENLRFLYIIINLTINYFETHSKQFLVKDHIEAVCSIDRNQVLTWLMVNDNKYWKTYIDESLEIWANTEFSGYEFSEGNWISETKKPFFRIAKRLRNRESAKFAQVYVLQWDADILKYILKQKGPYLLPWTIMAGSDFTFLIYIEARKKWPGKSSSKQNIKLDSQDLMDIFPVMISGDKQVPKTTEQFSHFVVSSLHEHATKFTKYIVSHEKYNFNNKDTIVFYDRDYKQVAINDVLKNKHLIARVKAHLGGITFNFMIDGIGRTKRTYLDISYFSADVIKESIPARILPLVTKGEELDKKQLSQRRFYSVSPQVHALDNILFNVDKIVNPGFTIRDVCGDVSYQLISEEVKDTLKSDRLQPALAAAGPMLNEHIIDFDPEVVKQAPFIESKKVRNFHAKRIQIAKFPAKETLKTHLWLSVPKTEFKETLTIYSNDQRIRNIVSELAITSGDFEDRIHKRIVCALDAIHPLRIGDYIITLDVMRNIFNALNDMIDKSKNLKYLDELYILITHNKRHIVKYSETINPIDDPVAFASAFKHYIK